MNAKSNELSVNIRTIEVNAKKITKKILDQIPRLDICDILISKECVTNLTYKLRPVCRFSLIALLESERRVCKTKGHNTQQINELISEYEREDEGFFFIHNEQIQCSSFSDVYGTKLYIEKVTLIENKLINLETEKRKINKTLKALNDGEGIEDAASIYYWGDAQLPVGPRRKHNNKPSNKFSSVTDFKDELESRLLKTDHETKLLRLQLEKFQTKISTLIDEIKKTPFVIF